MLVDIIIPWDLCHYSQIQNINLFIGGDGKGLPSKERNKKEIRRDSKTGFEKFEDYFDSDSDNTTLISPDTTSIDYKQSNNGIKI